MKSLTRSAFVMRASVSSAACILVVVGCASPGVVNRAVAVPQGLRASVPMATAEPALPTLMSFAEPLCWNANSALLARETSAEPSAATATYAASSTTPVRTGRDETGRFTIKGGYFDPETSASDDGWLLNLAWLNFINPHFAMEIELGYLDVPGNSQDAVDVDGWGVPLMFNGIGYLPLGDRFDIYAGLGLGFIYAEIESAIGVEDEVFLFAGDGLAGASFDLTDSVVIGLEGKYYITGRTDAFDWALDGVALLLTVGFNH